MGVVPRRPKITRFRGVGVLVIKTLDTCPNSEIIVHYPFKVKSLHEAKLLRKPSYSVMGRIVMSALLKSLLA